ncbi:MFS transporter [Marinimicrobium alkaliphilum]|uniref:MFS transporter n=1 Tax=Marinimicrobium alkaliphilum TaxID=2202654 RepID=UPI000DB9EC50|nr:MFS transporter [Marinimicrobium alkaliphilum]
MTKKPQLSFWQIWNMSFGFLGIQFGFALQNSNVSRIFQTLGAGVDTLPILWLAAPMTGLIVQPIIGYFSDKTWTGLGRRRPYFLYGAIAASLALVFMPHSPYLWVAAGMLWILDASINVSMEPFRAFVGDMLPEKQRTAGFAMQSFFIGIGSVVASALPWMLTNWLDVANTAAPGVIPPSVMYAFYVGAAVFFFAVLWTVVTTKEYSPEQLKAFAEYDDSLKEKRTDEILAETRTHGQYARGGKLWLASGVALVALISGFGLDWRLHIIAGGVCVFGILQLISGYMLGNGKINNGFYHFTHDFFHMPKTMKQLAVVQFFSWFALFCLWIYATPAITGYHYGTSDTASVAYNQGADWVGVLFASYNVFAAMAAFLIPVIAKLISRKSTHMVNLIMGGLGMISLLLIRDPSWLLVSMVGIGIAWASILSMPYAILSCSLPAHKMGIYMGIFNFFIVIPQILAVSILGMLVRDLFGGQAIYALALAGVCFFIAAAATLLVEDEGAEASL